MHQMLEYKDEVYQFCRKKFGSKVHLWETIRSYIKIIVFKTFEELLDFALTPRVYIGDGIKLVRDGPVVS